MAPPPPVALPQAPAATLTPDSALGLQSSDVVMEKKDVFVWYPATENDAKLEWNRRDAWRMVRFDASLGTEMVHFLAGPDAIAGTVGSTMLLRIGAPYAGVVIGTYLPGGNLVAGMEFARELALPLVDFGLPDVQLGMVFINPGARYVGNTDDVHTVQITTASPGLRLACCDLVKVDARVGIPQIWIGGFDSTVSAAVSWGFSLDAGVIF